MKRYIFIILLACISFPLFSQDDFIDFESFDAAEPIAVKGKAVLIVPFSNDMFNNQESESMLKKTNLEYEQTVNYFKSSLDSSIFNALDDSCKVISMLTGFAAETSSDLEKLHGAAHYYLAERQLIESKSKNSMFRSPETKENSVTQREEHIQKGEIVSVKQDMNNTFINVKFDDQMLINTIALKYGAKYLLFVNQFEILGDFSDPYLVAQKTYNRTIRVHYALFSSDGKFIEGDVVEQNFSALEDNIEAICGTNFPIIAKDIARKMPN